MTVATQGPLAPRALEGVRVLDLTDSSCVYATKVLADLGAEVIRIEPPAGDPMRRQHPFDDKTGESLFHAFMNVNKSSVTLDLETPAGRELFGKLVGSAAIVVESFAPGVLDAKGIGYAALGKANPGVVWVSVTPFGQTGPYAQWKADDLISQAMGGLMALSGVPDREPLRLFGEQSCYIAGLHAASGALIAYWESLTSKLGQHVDVSIQECIAHTLENAIQFYTEEGVVRSRQAGRVEAGVGVFPCTDGEIFVFANVLMISSSWHNLVAWMKAEKIPGAEQLEDPKWVEPAWRKTEEARKIAADLITQLTRTRTKNQVYDQLQQHHILSAPMSQVGDLFNNAQLKFLDWFEYKPWGSDRTAVWPGPPMRLSETPRRAPDRVAKPGEQNAAVLDGVGDAGKSQSTTKQKESAI